MIGKAKTQQRLIDNLEDEFVKVCAFYLLLSLKMVGQLPWLVPLYPQYKNAVSVTIAITITIDDEVVQPNNSRHLKIFLELA